MLEYKEFNYMTVFGTVFSFVCFFPLTVMFNDKAKTSFYLGEQFSTVYSSPTFQLTGFLCGLIITSVRFIWLQLEHEVFYP